MSSNDVRCEKHNLEHSNDFIMKTFQRLHSAALKVQANSCISSMLQGIFGSVLVRTNNQICITV